MGIFDIIELRQHIRSIGEYVFYLADVASQAYDDATQRRVIPMVDLSQSLDFIRDHLKKMSDVLDKFEKSS